jgi:hypothetical protein
LGLQASAPSAAVGFRSKLGCLVVTAVGMMIAFGIFVAIVRSIMASR